MRAIKFDIDGLLARFTTGACAIHGRPTDETSIWRTWNHQHSWGIDDKAFYAPMGTRFWAKLPVWDDGMALLERTINYLGGREAISFLTSPIKTGGCEEGKREWVANHLPSFNPWADCFIGGAKHKLAHPNAVLVDDSDSNVSKFRAAGGRALLVPRPWNARAAECDPSGSFHVGQLQDELRGLL